MKNKRIITIGIMFVLLLALGVSTFANDFGGDGNTLGVPIYPYIPIRSAQLDIVEANSGGSNGLDNFVVNLGGFSSLGTLSNMEYIGSYTGGSYRYNVEVNREENDSFYSITETIKPLGDLMNGHTSTRVYMETGSFGAHKYQGFWNSGVKPYVEALGTVANDATIQAVTYEYVARVWKLDSNSQVGSEVNTTFSYNAIQGEYVQTFVGTSNTTFLFPDAFFESIVNQSTLDQLENIGNSDKVQMSTYADSYIEILQCRLRFRIRWGSNTATSTKSIAIHNYYTTFENMQASVWRYGPTFIIDGNIGDTTIVNPPSEEAPPLNFEAFGDFISHTVGGFMNTAIFGSVTFGVIVYTVLGLGLLMWILKMWGGG